MTLEVRGVSISRAGRTVVDEVTFSADRGELVALMGASGSGKTTLLRAVAGLDPVDRGAIVVNDVDADRGSNARSTSGARRAVGIVFQFHHLFAHLTALENVSLALEHVLRYPRDAARQRAGDLLAALDVGGRAHARPHELSGGEAQRVAIARALAVEPSVLLLDEPTASLDRVRRDALAATLTRLAADGRTIIVASHDAEFVQTCAHRVLSLEHGRIAVSA
jgi:polar amino acid transport system ATP-binding protein